jgi:simple sugar transport system permease protein
MTNLIKTTSNPTVDASAPSLRAPSPVVTALRELVLLPVIAIVVVIGAVVTPSFFTLNNVVNNVFVTAGALGLLVLAESIILICGHIDLSLESTVGLAPMVGAYLVVPAAIGGSGAELPPAVGLVIMFAVGATVGLINGILVGVLKLNAFMVTLAMLILVAGLTLGISGGTTMTGLPELYTFLGSTAIAGISIQVWILVIAFIAAGFFMRYISTGRKIYATGGNLTAARSAGIKTTRLTVGVFIVGSLIAVFAGLLLTSRIASVTANQGSGMIFTVFAAAVIGGISLDGGKGSMIGAFTGVILLSLIQNILTLSSVPSYWINSVYGLIILAALLIGQAPKLRAQLGRLRTISQKDAS